MSGREHGIHLLVLILASDGSSGSSEFLMECGQEFYLFYEIAHQVLHIDGPSNLRNILFVLGTCEDLKVTPLILLPEYRGPNDVANNNVPSGWSNKIDKEISCTDRRILESTLFRYMEVRRGILRKECPWDGPTGRRKVTFPPCLPNTSNQISVTTPILGGLPR